MATTMERVRTTREQREELADLIIEAINATLDNERSFAEYCRGTITEAERAAARQQYGDHIRAIWRRFYEVTG
jgi:hypothetical protein